MRKLPPLNALRIFEACARSLNFSQAAHELCLTHSAVSHQIKQLESWFGQTLFTRHSSGVELTGAGIQLQPVAQSCLNRLEQTCEQLRVSSDHGHRSLTLAAPGSFLALWLIQRLEHFERTQPQWRLQLQTQGDYTDLSARRIDALVVSARPPWPDVLLATPLFEDRSGPVCAPDWTPLPRYSHEILAQPLLYTLSRQEAWTDWAALHQLDPAQLQLARGFDNLQLMLEAAVSRLGMAIAPERLVQRELNQQRLVAPLGFSVGPSCFAICQLGARSQEPGLRALTHWIQEQAAQVQLP